MTIFNRIHFYLTDETFVLKVAVNCCSIGTKEIKNRTFQQNHFVLLTIHQVIWIDLNRALLNHFLVVIKRDVAIANKCHNVIRTVSSKKLGINWKSNKISISLETKITAKSMYLICKQCFVHHITRSRQFRCRIFIPPSRIVQIKSPNENCAKIPHEIAIHSIEIAINVNKRGKTTEQYIKWPKVFALCSRLISICDVHCECVCVCSTCSQSVLRWRFLTVVYVAFVCVEKVAKKSIFRTFSLFQSFFPQQLPIHSSISMSLQSDL